MNHYYMDFDPYLIGERDEGLLREVSTHRLQKWLREERGEPSGWRLIALARTAMLPLLRGGGPGGALAQRETGEEKPQRRDSRGGRHEESRVAIERGKERSR